MQNISKDGSSDKFLTAKKGESGECLSSFENSPLRNFEAFGSGYQLRDYDPYLADLKKQF